MHHISQNSVSTFDELGMATKLSIVANARTLETEIASADGSCKVRTCHTICIAEICKLLGCVWRIADVRMQPERLLSIG